MLNFFLRKFNALEESYSIKQYSKFDYIKRRYLNELYKIRDYYYNKDNAVDNRHPLSKIITNVAPDINADVVDYLKIVEINAPFLAKQFGIVSNKSAGSIFKNVFYQYNSSEILLLVNNDIDVFSIENNWRDLKPLRCIYTPNTDLDLHMPNGTKSFDTESLSVFEIDLTMMVLQYKYWALERTRNDKSTNSNVFISTIVLPNTIGSILDLTLFNRYIAISTGVTIPNFDINYPFNVLDLSRGVDSIYKKIAKDTVDSSIYLEQLLESVPTIYNNNMHEALLINKPFYNKQSEWVLWVSRIKYINNLITILGEKGQRKNKTEINSLPANIKALERRQTKIDDKLEPELLMNFYQDINEIKKVVGSR